MKKTIIILLLVVILTGCNLIRNTYLTQRYGYYRNFKSDELVDKSPREKEGMILTFEETFEEERWNETGDSANWKIGGSDIYHPRRHNVWFGPPELREGGYAAFTTKYNPNDIYVYQLDSTITFPYESSKLITMNMFTQKYGRFECRMTLPKDAHHAWPAFWMWAGPWPPEIDVIEAYGKETGKDIVYQEINLHWGVQKNHKQWGAKKIKIDEYKNVGHNRFYEFAVEWRPDRIDFFTNGIRVLTFRDQDVLNKWFDKPMWVVINNSIHPTDVSVETLGENYYTEFLVDYIRVYKFKN